MSKVMMAGLMAAALGIGGGAQAGGFFGVAEAPDVMAPPPAMAESPWGGALWADWGSYDYENSSEEIEDDGTQMGYGGYVEGAFGGFYAALDGSRRSRDIDFEDEDFSTHAPDEVTAYGLHLGRDFGATRAAIFYGRNSYPGLDEDDEQFTASGSLWGLEAEWAMANGVALFGQLGRADMVSDDDGTPDDPDNFFDGTFARLGASAVLGRFGVAAAVERGGSSDGFSDGNDVEFGSGVATEESGEYLGLDLRVDYRVTDRLSVNASFERTDIFTDPVLEGDTGTEVSLGLGVTYAFGNQNARPNLVTPYRPGLAASWSESLD